MRQLFTFNYHILRTLHTKIERVKYSDFEHPTWRGKSVDDKLTEVSDLARAGWKPNKHIAQGKRSDTLGSHDEM